MSEEDTKTEKPNLVALPLPPKSISEYDVKQAVMRHQLEQIAAAGRGPSALVRVTEAIVRAAIVVAFVALAAKLVLWVLA